MASQSDRPAAVSFDLDKFEAESKGSKEPFVVKVGKRQIEFVNFLEIDWQDFLAAEQHRATTGDPTLIFRLIVPEKDREFFFGRKTSLGGLLELQKLYMDHYGYDPEQLAASQR